MRNEGEVIKVMVVEDDAGTREALAALIRGSPGFACTGAYRGAAAALEQLAVEQPEVVLVDLEMPGMSGVEFIRACRARFPQIEILVLTVHDETDFVFPALSAGATGYLVKGVSPTKLLEAIAEIASGGASMSGQVARMVLRTLRPAPLKANSELSARELEVLQYLSEGLRYDEIGEKLSVSTRTINSHLQRIYRKLHVHSATAALAKLRQRG